MDLGELGPGPESLESTGVMARLDEGREVVLDDRIEEAWEFAPFAMGVEAGSYSCVKKSGEGADASGGSSTSSSESSSDGSD
jgi:hypothetical protein